MKMVTLIAAAVLAAITSLMVCGCTSKPIDELKMVSVAMDQARSVEASEYAPYDWDRARMQWEEAIIFSQMGRYGEARDVLIEAIGNFNTARDKAQRRVESLKIEINALQSTAETELKKLEQAGVSPKAKPPVRETIDRAIPHIEEKIATMNADYDAKEYLQSRMAGQEAMRYIRDLRTRLGI
jgi:hypothetical protein